MSSFKKMIRIICIICSLLATMIFIVSLIGSIVYTGKFAYMLITSQLTMDLLVRLLISIFAMVGSASMIGLMDDLIEKLKEDNE